MKIYLLNVSTYIHSNLLKPVAFGVLQILLRKTYRLEYASTQFYTFYGLRKASSEVLSVALGNVREETLKLRIRERSVQYTYGEREGVSEGGESRRMQEDCNGGQEVHLNKQNLHLLLLTGFESAVYLRQCRVRRRSRKEIKCCVTTKKTAHVFAGAVVIVLAKCVRFSSKSYKYKICKNLIVQ